LVLPPIYILIEDNPNCAALDGLVFQPKAPPRQVKRVRVARDGASVWCEIAAVSEGWMTEPATASPIDDSGDGACYLISGGAWGLKLTSETGEFGEPYLLLGYDGKDIEFV
jgi:hypothetical protein